MFVLFGIIISNFTIGQKKIVVVDSTDNFPIENVRIFSLTNDLIAISNAKGEIELNGSGEFVARSGLYNDFRFSTEIDTISLTPKIHIINEVKIKPINTSDFYNSLIESSKKQALIDTTQNLYATYFESVLIIDLELQDSIFQTKECQMIIQKNHSKKNIDYKFDVFAEKKSYWLNMANEHMDTTVLEKWSNIIPKLKTLFDYDLTNDSNYKINFEDKKSERNENQLIISNNKLLFDVKFENNQITSWNTTNTNYCKPSESISMCFQTTSKTLEFSNNEYYLNNAFLYGEVYVSFGDKKFLIKMKKGFVENLNKSNINNSEITIASDVEDIFKTIPFSKDEELVKFYIFN